MKTNREQRKARLMTGGAPRYVRVYDNGGETADLYTVCYTGRAATKKASDGSHRYPYRVMSASPFHPQGIGLFCYSDCKPCDVNAAGWPVAMGRKCHLGRRIAFAALPDDCRKLVLRDYREIWGI